MAWIRPAIVEASATPIDARTEPRAAADRLERGERLLVTDRTATGIAVVDALWSRLGGTTRQARRAYRDAALRLLERIEGHRSTLDGSSGIGFLAELYPNEPDLVLPFVQMQELKHAWDLYEDGVHLAVLGHRVHPFYGAYVPHRTSHLELFATWLHGDTGALGRAVDVGTGCGVLAMMLARRGFASVAATDVNPNAVESVRREIERHESYAAIHAEHADLLGTSAEPFDLVVFNPPWVKGEVVEPLDAALVWDDERLFARFFAEVALRLADDGRVVVLFSTVGSLVQPEVPHPLVEELERGRFRLEDKRQRRVKPTPAPDGTRRRTKERVEVWVFARA